MNSQFDNTPSLPSLPPDLHCIYLALPEDMKRIFVKVFRYLWEYITPYQRFLSHGGVLYSYWVVDLLRHKYGLTSSELSILTYLYFVTDKGKKIIHSDVVYNGMLLPDLTQSRKQRILYDFKIKGYIKRLTRNPSAPYLRRSISRQPVFIKMTPKGVDVIHDIEKGIYKLLFNTSLNEITGVNKKP